VVSTALLGILVLVAFVGLPTREPAAEAFAGLGECIRFETEQGWRLAQPPTLSGPYRRSGIPYLPCFSTGGSGREAVTYHTPRGGVSHQFSPGVGQVAIPLQTPDGAITIAVLEH
jgi:hypothetical protein